MGEESFPSPLHDTGVTVRVGTALGVAITVCFVTGLISHFAQNPVRWLPLPTSPTWGYRVTQGVHVAFGIAAIPLAGVKLWAVYPKLFQWPPAKSLVNAIERITVGLLVVTTLFQLVTGLLNIAHWYPWTFGFTQSHYAVAWLLAGSVLLHLAVKAPAIRAAYSRKSGKPPAVARKSGEPAAQARSAGDRSVTMTRRGLLLTSTAAVGAVTLATVGQSVPWLQSLALLAPRRPAIGPQGLPVNRTYQAAGVLSVDPASYRLAVGGVRPLSLDLQSLAAFEQVEVDLPIACVEGWSALARWGGVRLRDLLEAAGVPAGTPVRVTSMEQVGAYRTAVVPPQFAWNSLTLLASRVNGQPLDLQHGYPLRLIAPNRPGVLQTKWVQRVDPL